MKNIEIIAISLIPLSWAAVSMYNWLLFIRESNSKAEKEALESKCMRDNEFLKKK